MPAGRFLRTLPVLLITLSTLLVPSSAKETGTETFIGDTFRVDSTIVAREPVNCSPWLFAPIGLFDAPLRVNVATNDLPGTNCENWEDWSSDEGLRLFGDLPSDAALDWSYQATCELCDQLDLAQDSGDYAAIQPDIWEYLDRIAQQPALRYALAASGTTVEDLYATWFGPGQGFEHAMCGEKDPENTGNTGGYHFWYRFYQEERREGDGHVNWRCTLEGAGDPGIATIRFDWNPLGNDDYRIKPIGGFTVGNSAAAMLALGHLALWRDCDIAEYANDFVADINGHTYEWVVVTREGSLHTLYPKALDLTLPRD